MVEVKDGCLIPTKDEALYMAQALAGMIFCAYEGDKDQDGLIKNPETIEPDDYKEICLSWNEVEKAKNLINALVNIYKD